MTDKQRSWVLLSGVVCFFAGALGMIYGYLERRGNTHWPSWA